MGRKRIIDLDELLFDTQLFAALGWKGVLFYVRLWTLAEDWGGLEPRYDDLALKCGHLAVTPEEAQYYTHQLILLGKIIPYNVNGGREILWLKNLLKHQRLNNSACPKLPPPPWLSFSIKTGWNKRKVLAEVEISWDQIPMELPEKYKIRPTPPLSLTHVMDVGTVVTDAADRRFQKIALSVDGKPVNLFMEPGWEIFVTDIQILSHIKEKKRREKIRKEIKLVLFLTEKYLSIAPQSTTASPQKSEKSATSKIDCHGQNETVPDNQKIVMDNLKSSQQLLDLWNEISPIPGLRPVEMTEERRRKMLSRLKWKADRGFWRTVFEKVRDNPFLRGETKGWKATLDWLIKNNTNPMKVYEGQYDDQKPRPPGGRPPGRSAGSGKKYAGIETTYESG
jgi:hypothetical protein